MNKKNACSVMYYSASNLKSRVTILRLINLLFLFTKLHFLFYPPIKRYKCVNIFLFYKHLLHLHKEKYTFTARKGKKISLQALTLHNITETNKTI